MQSFYILFSYFLLLIQKVNLVTAINSKTPSNSPRTNDLSRHDDPMFKVTNPVNDRHSVRRPVIDQGPVIDQLVVICY